MKRIRKGRGPSELTVYAKQSGDPPPSYSDMPAQVRAQLAAALTTVQRGLCCYCQARLGADFKVEHFKPQSAFPELDLKWGNLWAACPGNPGPPRNQTCDTRKGATAIGLDPGQAVADRCTFKGGRLEHPSPVHDTEANEALGLNAIHLIRRRQAAVQGFQAALRLKKSGSFSRGFLETQRDDLARREVAPPFEAAILYWLNRKISRAN